MKYPTTTLEAASLPRMDLRKYNVIVLPNTWGGPGVYKRLVGKEGAKKLKEWVQAGGTLVAFGSGAAFLADTTVALSSVRQKRQVLGKIDRYDWNLDQMKAAESSELDSLDLWEPKAKEKKEDEKKTGDKPAAPGLEELKKKDAVALKLRPRGAILAAALDPQHWLAFGERSPVPAMVYTGYVYLAGDNVQVAARYETKERLRLSGLLWPEARERWSETAYATREGKGNGQIILFAGTPNFRAYFHGGERLLLNAIFLGPGFGTRPALDW
jgi:hypothetical protein